MRVIAQPTATVSPSPRHTPSSTATRSVAAAGTASPSAPPAAYWWGTLVGGGRTGSAGCTNGVGTAATFNNVFSVAPDGRGNVVVGDSCGPLRIVNLATRVVSALVGAWNPFGYTAATAYGAQAAVSNPVRGLAGDGAGKVYLADTSYNVVRVLVVDGAAVTTIAGGGGVDATTAGMADGAGSNAMFRAPSGVSYIGSSATLLVADTGNHRLRLVVIATAAVTTLAGGASGTVGGFLDGQGTNAKFNTPYQAAADALGNAYVADFVNNVVRRIVIATGVVTTLAGGGCAGCTTAGYTDDTGTWARFNQPYGVVVVGGGNVLITDYNNHAVRYIAAATAFVSTVAGQLLPGAGYNSPYSLMDGAGTHACFYAPQGIAYDAATSMAYIAEWGNWDVRTLDTVTWVASTLAGTGGVYSAANAASSRNAPMDGVGRQALFSMPTGVAADTSGNVFVADRTNNLVRIINASTGATMTLAGGAGIRLAGAADGVGTNALFGSAYLSGLAADVNGNVFVADTRNNKIRQVIVSTGAVTTVAGGGAGGTTGGFADSGLFGNGTGTAALFNAPFGLAVWRNTLFVADTANNLVRAVALGTGADDDALISQTVVGAVVRTLAGGGGPAGTAAGHADAAGTSATFTSPAGIAVDAAGATLFVSDSYACIRKVVLSTLVVTTLAGLGTAAGNSNGQGTNARFNWPQGLAVDMLGTALVVVDTNNHIMRRVVIATGATTAIGGVSNAFGDGAGTNARFFSPYGVAVSPYNGATYLKVPINGL